jgi:hypothetical protein
VRLLFTDIQMPGALDGMDLARAVHARWPGVLLVIASGRIKPRWRDPGRWTVRKASLMARMSFFARLMIDAQAQRGGLDFAQSMGPPHGEIQSSGRCQESECKWPELDLMLHGFPTVPPGRTR